MSIYVDLVITHKLMGDPNIGPHYLPSPLRKEARSGGRYGYGLTRGHGYVDGNKRVGFVAMAVFLDINGWRLEAPEPEVAQIMVAVASGELTETELATWVRSHVRELIDAQAPDA